jgi:hypothetical protein
MQHNYFALQQKSVDKFYIQYFQGLGRSSPNQARGALSGLYVCNPAA